VLCWGSGARGRLGNGDEQGESRTVPTPVVGLAGPQVAIATGYEHTCAVSRAGAVSCWGYNEFGATGQASAWAVSPVPVTGTFSASP
jgi:alpha-tubulin suppressor-like RCC1 family protein